MQVVWAQKRQSRNGNHREVRYDNHSFSRLSSNSWRQKHPSLRNTATLPERRCRRRCDGFIPFPQCRRSCAPGGWNHVIDDLTARAHQAAKPRGTLVFLQNLRPARRRDRKAHTTRRRHDGHG